jgi:hypothetical protein
MKNETTLTAKEDKMAKRCAAQYKSFPVRHANIIGWLGVVLFALGLLPITVLNENIKSWLTTIPIFMIFYGMYSDLTIIIGKLYEQLMDQNANQKDG